MPPFTRGRRAHEFRRVNHGRLAQPYEIAQALRAHPRFRDTRDRSRARDRSARVILIVEDDENTRRLYLHILSQAGIACLATGEAQLALRWARAERFEAVVLDLGLPRVSDGLQLAALLRALPDPPALIAATGHQIEEPALRLFSTALAKPIDAQTLVDTVRRYAGEQFMLPW